MRVVLSLVLLIFSVPAVAGSVSLDGKVTQGGLVVGRTDPGTVVKFKNIEVREIPDRGPTDF